MKRIFCNTIACCAALLALAACEKTEDLSETGAGSGAILINFSSGDMTRAEEGAFDFENRVDHLDVLIFDENNTENNTEKKAWYERIEAGTTATSGTVALKAKRSKFGSGKRYWVYVIANANDTEKEQFEKADLTKSTFLDIKREDMYIHLTGMPLENSSDIALPQTFLMDGVAYKPENPTTTLVTLNDGDEHNDTKLKVDLRRAAVKLELNLKPGKTTNDKGEVVSSIKFLDPQEGSGIVDPETGSGGANQSTFTGGYYVRNMPYNTYLAAESTYDENHDPTLLRTPRQTRNHYFELHSSGTETTEEGKIVRVIDGITVTAYAYAHSWEIGGNTVEREPRWIVDIPLQYTTTENTAAGNRDIKTLKKCYYQILICKGSELKRNHYYRVNAEVRAPGGTDPSLPLELKDIEYTVREWGERNIDVGGEDERPKFLTVNRTEMELHETNVVTRETDGVSVRYAVDDTSVEFASSSKVTATVTRAYYIDKFGNEVEVSDAIRNAITLKPTADLNGYFTIESPVPNNNTARYIEVKITNEDKVTVTNPDTGIQTEELMTRYLTITQYGVINITNILGYYSYRSDFGGTTWENANTTEKRVTAYGFTYDKEKKEGKWKYSATEYGGNISIWLEEYDSEKRLINVKRTGYGDPIFFTSMVAEDIPEGEVTDANRGKSTISRYIYYTDTKDYLKWWDTRKKEWKAGDRITRFVRTGNARMYHVEVTATSADYTVGRPRITDGKTDPGSDNANLVSPSFLIASQLGAVSTTCFDSAADDETAYEMAASHCEQYVEVAKNGTVYGDWRLPTAAEIGVITNLQYNTADGAAMDEVMTGYKYYSASGIVLNEGSDDYVYETDDKGNIIKDENNNPVIKKDEEGNPIRQKSRFLRCVHDFYQTQDTGKSGTQEAGN